VVVDNFAYGAVEALGLGYDVLARANPRIVYLALKGFLPGPNEAQPFLDELAQMSAGLAFMTGPRGQPMRAGASIVDVGAAAYGVIAVLAALQQRAKTGLGQRITSGLFETTVFWVGQWLAQYGATGEPSVPLPEMKQGTRMGWGIYQLFTAADGEEVFVGITSNGHWERFCKEFALGDLLADSRLDDNAKRVAARGWLPARIAEEMQRYPSAGWRSGSPGHACPTRPCAGPISSWTIRTSTRRSNGSIPHCPGAAQPSCPSFPCGARRSRWGCAAPPPGWASTRAKCWRSLDSPRTRSTRWRHGGSFHERPAEDRADQGSGTA
jgi:Predicted acyl-CoA transferases/carnitine dehydratase